MEVSSFVSVMTICSAGLGLVGAALGIINTLSLLLDRRIGLEVHLEFAYKSGERYVSFDLPTTASRKGVTEKLKQGRTLNPSVRIVNKSKYAIFVTNVGLSRNRRLANRMELFPTIVRPAAEPPYRMEPFSSLILTCADIDVLTLPLDARFVYATVAHGKCFFARLPRLRKSLIAYQAVAREGREAIKDNPLLAELVK